MSRSFTRSNRIMVLLFGISAGRSRGDGAVTAIDQAKKRLKIPVWMLLPGLCCAQD
jgi:hypothetical protein